MTSIRFRAFGHPNIRASHGTTIELTSENEVTIKGDCIIGVSSTLTLSDLSKEIRAMASKSTTRIVLTISVDGTIERIRGYGKPGLTYKDSTCMVTRTSDFVCDRTLMVNADKASRDINRRLVNQLLSRDTLIDCQLDFITQ